MLLPTRLQQLPLGDETWPILMRILSFNLGVEFGQIAALTVMVWGLALWRKRESFGKFSHAANLGLIAAGFYLLFVQLHGYQHDVHSETFRFPVEEHRHIHEDMGVEQSTDKIRNSL